LSPSRLGDQIPARGGPLSRFLGRAALRALGWRFEGQLPNVPQFVAIVAPHTSNWDFVVGVAAKFALGIDVSWLGKHSLFRWPLGMMLRWLGGMPVDRRTANNVVDHSVAAFANRERLVLAITPEGTRSDVERWRTGFYHIARGAGVPVVVVAFDWGRRVIRFGPTVVPSGAVEADMRYIRSLYDGIPGLRGAPRRPAR
jgi:1-acyl-sn-glycerol-3-phosphate acyltransferase